MKLVLVVEDEYGALEILKLLLEAEGYRVATASNGKEALKLLEGEVPALVLSDFMMPVMNGAELGEAIRCHTAAHDVPFVFISGTDEAVVRQSFRNYDAFIKKPFDIDGLLSMVERLISSGRPAQPDSEAVSESMRQLLKGIDFPPNS